MTGRKGRGAGAACSSEDLAYPISVDRPAIEQQLVQFSGLFPNHRRLAHRHRHSSAHKVTQRRLHEDPRTAVTFRAKDGALKRLQ